MLYTNEQCRAQCSAKDTALRNTQIREREDWLSSSCFVFFCCLLPRLLLLSPASSFFAVSCFVFFCCLLPRLLLLSSALSSFAVSYLVFFRCLLLCLLLLLRGMRACSYLHILHEVLLWYTHKCFWLRAPVVPDTWQVRQTESSANRPCRRGQ